MKRAQPRRPKEHSPSRLMLLLGLALVSLGGPPTALAHDRDKHQNDRQEPLAEEEPTPSAEVSPGAPSEQGDRPALHPDQPRKHLLAEPSHEYPPEGVPRPLAWLGKFHPPAVNFPIAMLTAAALSELLVMRTGRELFFHATRFSVWMGSLGALAAATLGWLFAGFRLADDEWLMTTHRWLGTSASAWALVVLFLCERAYRTAERQAFRLALFPGAALTATTGFFGGALLYGIDHYAW